MHGKVYYKVAHICCLPALVVHGRLAVHNAHRTVLCTYHCRVAADPIGLLHHCLLPCLKLTSNMFRPMPIAVNSSIHCRQWHRIILTIHIHPPWTIMETNSHVSQNVLRSHLEDTRVHCPSGGFMQEAGACWQNCHS